jgi:nicotinamidase-related amidase
MQIDLNYPDPIPVSLEPAKTMLLIVDMENEDAHPTGKRYMGEAVEQIIPKIAALRRRVRQAGGSSFHTNPCANPTR